MRFEPGTWSPPKSPTLEGPFAKNSILNIAIQIDVGGVGPEDVLVDQEGRIVVGLEDGRIMRIDADGDRREEIANTGGRPLGLELGNNLEVVICDSEKGLLSLSSEGQLRTLVAGLPGEPPFRFTNNATVAEDGTIYFTDSSRNFGIADFMLDLLEHAGTGRLLAHHPNGSTEVLLDGLKFPNGVALSPEEDFLLFAETGTYTISKYWLTGRRAGSCESFIENLPGFPDNLSRYKDIYWVAIPSLRQAAMDFLLPRPRLRTFVAKLPDWLKPPMSRHGFVIGLNANAEVVYNLQDSKGRVRVVTGVRQLDDKLYLGNLGQRSIAVHQLE